ncbi:MAG: DUF4265 domain-containing protein [Imperialibacter sp.]|uniref:DUF4265 domain-containing protein n=1 Tax=Imperialibacter sp. TaxID=2038411 RepID=UPI0032ED3D86
MTEDGLVKLHIELPKHWAIGGESLWAEPLGNDLFKIQNVPFYAYGLNYCDTVVATPDSKDSAPEIRKLVEAGGHRTLRLYFNQEIGRAHQEEILKSLLTFGATCERADARLVAIDIKPNGDYLAVFNELETYLEKEILIFETCEERAEGSFDDSPIEDAN